VLTGIIICMIVIHCVVQWMWTRDQRHYRATEELLERSTEEVTYWQRKFNQAALVVTAAKGLYPYLDMSFDSTGMTVVEQARSRAAEYQKNVLVRSLGDALGELGEIDYRSFAEYQIDLLRAVADEEGGE
jgi:hypothetical protein